MDNITIHTIAENEPLVPIYERSQLIQEVDYLCRECLKSVDLTGWYFVAARWGGLNSVLTDFKIKDKVLNRFTYVTIRGSYKLNQTVLGTKLAVDINTKDIKIVLSGDRERLNTDNGLFAIQVKGPYENTGIADYIAEPCSLTVDQADAEAITSIEWLQHDVIDAKINEVLSNYMKTFLTYRVRDGFHRKMGANHQLSFTCDRDVIEARGDIVRALDAPDDANVVVYGKEVIVRWTEKAKSLLPANITDVVTGDGVTRNTAKKEKMDDYFAAADAAHNKGGFLTYHDWKAGKEFSNANAGHRKTHGHDDDDETSTIADHVNAKAKA